MRKFTIILVTEEWLQWRNHAERKEFGADCLLAATRKETNMADTSPIVEGFSLSHAAILDGSTGAEKHDIYGVRQATIEVDTDSYDNTGDDAVLSSWQWVNFATVTVQSGYIPFDMVADLSNTTITSSGTGTSMSASMALWGVNALNVSPRPMLCRIPSRDSGGASRVLDIVLYKVQFAPMSFDGPTYRDGLVVSYTGKAVMSSTDEAGQPLTEQSIGRIITTPQS